MNVNTLLRLSVSCVLALVIACDGEEVSRAEGLIAIDPQSIDFGSVPLHAASGSRTLHLRNDGRRTLTLSRVVIQGADSASFTSPSFDGATVAPAASLDIVITVSTEVSGLLGAFLHLESDATNAPVLDVQLRASIDRLVGDAGGTLDAGTGNDAGVIDGGNLVDAGGETTDGGSPSDGGQSNDDGVLDGGPPSLDASVGVDAGGCVGSWRVAPSNMSVNRVYGVSNIAFWDGGVVVFQERNAVGTVEKPYFVPLDGSPRAPFIDVGSDGQCQPLRSSSNDVVVLCRKSGGGNVVWQRTGAGAWEAGPVSASICPQPASWCAALSGGTVFNWSCVSNQAVCSYDLATKSWAVGPNTPLPNETYRGNAVGGRYVAVAGRTAWVLSADHSTWQPNPLALPDGGSLSLVSTFTFGDRLLFNALPEGSTASTPWVTAEFNVSDGGVTELATTGTKPARFSTGSISSYTTTTTGLVVPIGAYVSGVTMPRAWHFTLDGGVWTQLGGEPIDRRFYSSITSSDDTFYSFGGVQSERSVDGGLPRGNLWRLDQTTATWQPLDDDALGVPRAGQGYAIGLDETRTKVIFPLPPEAVLDPVTFAWSVSTHQPFEYPTMLVRGGTQVSAAPWGGQTGATLRDGGWVPWATRDAGVVATQSAGYALGDDVFVSTWAGAHLLYSTTTRHWAELPIPAIASPRRDFISAPLGSTGVFIYGGTSVSSAAAFADGALYDHSTSSWALVTDAGAPAPTMINVASEWSGSEVLVLGMATAAASTSSFFAYRPATDTWSKLTAPPFAPRSNTTPSLLHTSRGVLVISGLADAALYDRASDTWQCVAPRPALGTAASYSSLVVNGTVVVAASGSGGEPLEWTAVLEGL